MKVSLPALDRATKIIRDYEASKAEYDAGDKKKGYWRILEKDLPLALELRHLASMREPEPVQLTRTIYKLDWSQAIVCFLGGAFIIFALAQGGWVPKLFSS